MPIQRIYCHPAICVARVGGSSVPVDAFRWVASADPHNVGETRIEPAWTLDVQPDGRVSPRMPEQIVLRDQGQIRPVAPFVELWCEVGEADAPEGWTSRPLTTAVLAAEGLNVANLTFEVMAMNLKVERRTQDPAHRFGTLSPVVVRGDDHRPHGLRGESPPPGPGGVRMIPAGRAIPLGQVQVIRPGVQPPPGGAPWTEEVDVETVRLRFTPPRGELYGPDNGGRIPVRRRGTAEFPGYPEVNAFLDPDAGWLGAVTVGGLAVPGDTYDGAETATAASEGVVDDTSEVRVVARLDRGPAGATVLQGHATIFCGPPDYAPDRRPFLSLADSFNDRAGDKAARNRSLSDAELDRWVEDLFERAYETVSLLNVDLWRGARGASLSAEEQGAPIPGDAYPEPGRAMGARDALRDPEIALPAPSRNVPLPMADRAKERHRFLSDLVALKRFIRNDPGRLEALIRRPFRVSGSENPNATTMQMPPFMRHSNAQPLSLVEWQYDLLMEWQRRVLAGPVTIEEEVGEGKALSDPAARRRAAVLGRLDAFGEI